MSNQESGIGNTRVEAATLPARSHRPVGLHGSRDGFGGGVPRPCTAQSADEESGMRKQ